MRSYMVDVNVLAKDGSGDVVQGDRIIIRAENLDDMRKQIIKEYSKHRTMVNAYYLRRWRGRTMIDRLIINRDGTVEYHDHNLDMWNVDPRTGRLKSRIPAPKGRWRAWYIAYRSRRKWMRARRSSPL